MKKLLVILSLLFTLGATGQMKKIISSPPDPPKLVNDFTNTLTPQQVEALESKLYQYDDSTSNQIAVVIVPSTDGYSIEDAALELGRNWGVGSKEFNNGVVLLVAKEDRKMTIQVGYGLEGAVPDVVAKSIIDDIITPNFKEGNYYRGIDLGTDNIIKAAEGRYKAPENYGNRKKDRIPVGAIIVIIIILLIIFGSASSGGGTYVSRGGFGGWSGRGWSGGGSSGGGGGFGGFGGGSFGGGGASGSW
jgi:uncharacterized protein